MNEQNISYYQPNQQQMVASQSPMLMQTSPNGRGARFRQFVMSGKSFTFTSLPAWFSTYAIGTYAVALLGVNFINSTYAMEWYFWVFGMAWVAGFFMLSVHYSRIWDVTHIRRTKNFEKRLFKTGFIIRAIYGLFIYVFYLQMTGRPHEFQGADSISYIELAGDWVNYWSSDRLGEVLAEELKRNMSDMGFPFYEMIFLRMFGEKASYILLRLMNALIGAYSAVIIYRIASRSFDESTARITGIFCMLHPVLICYSGILLKEILMTFLVLLFIDLGDRLLRSRRFTFATIAPMILVGFSLFFFRTVLGIIAFMALFFAIVMSDSRIVSWGKKISVGVLVSGVLLLAASENIIREVQQVTNTDAREQQERSLEYRYGEKKGGGSGNSFAKYAGTAVFAPLIFTIPFPTMVIAEGQEDMRLIHGGNWMRNVMSGFVILAMFMLLLSGDWRKYTLPLAMLLGYLLMLAFTEFAHSLRFHIPVMPFEMMFAAYAITNMRKKHRNWYMIWCLFMVVACFAWNWFKLAGRGLS